MKAKFVFLFLFSSLQLIVVAPLYAGSVNRAEVQALLDKHYAEVRSGLSIIGGVSSFAPDDLKDLAKKYNRLNRLVNPSFFRKAGTDAEISQALAEYQAAYAEYQVKLAAKKKAAAAQKAQKIASVKAPATSQPTKNDSVKPAPVDDRAQSPKASSPEPVRAKVPPPPAPAVIPAPEVFVASQKEASSKPAPAPEVPAVTPGPVAAEEPGLVILAPIKKEEAKPVAVAPSPAQPVAPSAPEPVIVARPQRPDLPAAIPSLSPGRKLTPDELAALTGGNPSTSPAVTTPPLPQRPPAQNSKEQEFAQDASSVASVTSPASSKEVIQKIQKIADSHTSCGNSKVSNRSRLKTKPGFYHGVLVSFARSLCRPNDVVKAAMVKQNVSRIASLKGPSPYDNNLKTTFNRLLSLGLWESNGNFREGVDRSKGRSRSQSAEAGAFQTSYDVRGALNRTARAGIQNLESEYKSNSSACLNDVTRSSAARVSVIGGGAAGDFQRLLRTCPALAVEHAAITLNNNPAHYGPAKRGRVNPFPACNKVFDEVQKYVNSQRDVVCSALAVNSSSQVASARSAPVKPQKSKRRAARR